MAKPKGTTRKQATYSPLSDAVGVLAMGPAGAGLPGDMQIRTDILLCLMDAMTDRFPITREEITPDLVPSGKKIGADAQGWGICLHLYGSYLRALRPIYGFYVHKGSYDGATLNKSVQEIVAFLKAQLLAQFGGDA